MRVLAADGRFALTFAAPRPAWRTETARVALDIGVTSARPAGWSTRTDRSFVFTRPAGCTGDARTALDIGVTFARPARLAWGARSTRTDCSVVSTRSAGNGRVALDIGLTSTWPLAWGTRSTVVSTRSAGSTARCFMVGVEVRRAWPGLEAFCPGSFERPGLGRRSHCRSTMIHRRKKRAIGARAFLVLYL